MSRVRDRSLVKVEGYFDVELKLASLSFDPLEEAHRCRVVGEADRVTGRQRTDQRDDPIERLALLRGEVGPEARSRARSIDPCVVPADRLGRDLDLVAVHDLGRGNECLGHGPVCVAHPPSARQRRPRQREVLKVREVERLLELRDAHGLEPFDHVEERAAESTGQDLRGLRHAASLPPRPYLQLIARAAARTCPRSRPRGRRRSRPAASRGSCARPGRPSTGAARPSGSASRR